MKIIIELGPDERLTDYISQFIEPAEMVKAVFKGTSTDVLKDQLDFANWDKAELEKLQTETIAIIDKKTPK